MEEAEFEPDRGEPSNRIVLTNRQAEFAPGRKKSVRLIDAPGDKVVVQARIAKTDTAPYSARRLVDQTHPPVADDDDPPVEASAS